jgi:hypothetical protein
MADHTREERSIHGNKAAMQALRDQKLKRGVLGRHVFCRQDGKKYGAGSTSRCVGRSSGLALSLADCTRSGIRLQLATSRKAAIWKI